MNEKNKKMLLLSITVGLILIVVIGVTYAWLTQRLNGEQVQRIKAANIALELDDKTSNGILIDKAIPMSDSDGLQTTAYTFRVINKGDTNVGYRLYLDDEAITGERIPDNLIKYSITRNGGEAKTALLSTTHQTENGNTVRMIEDTVINKKGNSDTVATYTLKLWIDSSATTSVANKIFKGKIRLEGEQTEDSADDTYSLSGYLYDDNNNLVTNGTIVTYSEPKYATTNSEGYFRISGLEYGTHNIYYVPGKTVTEVKSMNKGQIEAVSGVKKGTVRTGSNTEAVDLASGYEIKNSQVKKVLSNEYIKKVYTYNQNGSGTEASYTGCLGGAEAGCASGEIVHKKTNTYPAGTIIKYEVSDGVEKYFNVLHDNGETLTLQQRENTLNNVAWYSGGNDNRHGPTTALTALENATSSWSYVNNMSYSIGDNNSTLGYSGCRSYSSCDTTSYSLTKSNVKARMITVQEAKAVGCTESGSCKKFISNYLMHAKAFSYTSFDGSSSTGQKYWTMSAYVGDNPALVFYPWSLTNYSKLVHDDSTSAANSMGVRAVVEINK